MSVSVWYYSPAKNQTLDVNPDSFYEISRLALTGFPKL